MKFESKYCPNTWNWNAMPRADVIEWATYASVSNRLTERWRAFGDAPRILDLGCGAGRNTAFFARHGFNVTGMDIDSRPLEVAGAVARAFDLNFDLRCGDMLNIPYPDNHFDAVYADNILSLTCYDGLRRAVSEILRVLRPGGEAFMEFLEPTCGYADCCRKVGGRTYLGPSQYGGHTVPVTFVTRADVNRLLRGFRIIDDTGAVHGYRPAPDQILILAQKMAVRGK